MINPTKIKIISPETIHAVNGFELNVYKNNFIRSLAELYNDNIELFSTGLESEMKSRRESAKINSTSARNEIITAKLFNNYGLEIQSKDITLEILAATGLGVTKNILMVGDSITANSQITTAVRNNFVTLGGTTPTFVGTEGIAPNNHEGISGYSWTSFNSSSSPFWSGSAIDFDWYATNQLGGITIDCISFQLGVNDSFVVLKTDAEIEAVVQNAKDLINAFISYNASGKIVVILPSCAVNSADGWADSYGSNYRRNDYVSNIYNLQAKLIETFDEGVYNSNVFVNVGGFCLDRTDGIAKDPAENKNSRIPVQYEFYNQALHPYATGGHQTIADGIFPTFLKVLT